MRPNQRTGVLQCSHAERAEKRNAILFGTLLRSLEYHANQTRHAILSANECQTAKRSADESERMNCIAISFVG